MKYHPSQELCLSEAELERLINGTHTLETLGKIVAFARGPTCQLAQYLRIMSVLYDKLDADKIPYCALGIDRVVEILDFSFTALIGLGATIRLWLNKIHQQDFWKQLAKGLCDHWPDVRHWVLFLYQNIIVQEILDVHTRHICKNAVLDFLGLVRDNRLRAWSKSIPADREVMKIICDLWYLEIRDSRFPSWHNDQRGSPIFCTCLFVTRELGGSIDWENILSVFQGDPELIASASLCHLEREISNGDELDILSITADLQIVTTLSQQENIRIAYMRQGVITITTEILAFVVDRKWDEDVEMFAKRGVAEAVALLRARIEEMDALPFLSQALERGLVASLLKCEPALLTLKSVGQSVAFNETLLLLGEVLPGYSIYRSILHQLTLAVDSAIGQGLHTKLSKGGGISVAWERLKYTIDERRKLVKRDVSSGHVQTCQNDMCSRTSHIARFKRCGGCLHAYYCSLDCQQYDWKNGKHKQYCTRVQQRFVRSHGDMSPVHSKDLKFLDQIILNELKKHRVRLGSQPVKLTLVELSFLIGGQVADVFFDARGEKANPFGTKCKCELYSNARWKHMAEAVREGKKPMVLVRAFFPGGMSRKIVLQAIPWAMVVEGRQDQRRNRTKVVEKYQFNLIFTCCGSEGNYHPVTGTSGTSRGFKDVKVPKMD